MWAEKEILENAFPCALANLYEAMPSLVGSKHISKGVGSMRAEKDEDMERLQLRAESKKNHFTALVFGCCARTRLVPSTRVRAQLRLPSLVR